MTTDLSQHQYEGFLECKISWK